jgi:hypothetical protein
MREQKGVCSMVMNFFPIVGLNAHNGVLKLCLYECVECNQSSEDIRFLAERESPSKI